MKHTKNTIVCDSIEARELALCTENYDSLAAWINSVIKTLAKHYKKNRFDPEKAIDAFYPIATAGSNLYKKDFGYSFTTTERYTAASYILKRYMEDIQWEAENG